MHKAIKEVTEDISRFKYNTAIAHIMTYVNQITDSRQQITDKIISSLLLLLAPFAPHMTEELWQQLSVVSGQLSDEFQSIHLQKWPTWDTDMLIEDNITIIVQVNGKLRDTLEVENQKSKVKSHVENKARESQKVQKYIENKKINKTIFVPGQADQFCGNINTPFIS